MKTNHTFRQSALITGPCLKVWFVLMYYRDIQLKTILKFKEYKWTAYDYHVDRSTSFTTPNQPHILDTSWEWEYSRTSFSSLDLQLLLNFVQSVSHLAGPLAKLGQWPDRTGVRSGRSLNFSIILSWISLYYMRPNHTFIQGPVIKALCLKVWFVLMY